MTRSFSDLTKGFNAERRERIEQRKIELRHVLKQSQEMLSRDIVERDPAICSGQLVFSGTRIPVAVVVEQLRAGVSPTELQEDFPQLSRTALDYAEIQAQHAKDQLQ
jgi:uncharacterized protein (DUF433 family)